MYKQTTHLDFNGSLDTWCRTCISRYFNCKCKMCLWCSLSSVETESRQRVCSLFTGQWNSPCKVTMCTRVTLHRFLLCILSFTYKDGCANRSYYHQDVRLCLLSGIMISPPFAFDSYFRASWCMQMSVSLPVLKRVGRKHAFHVRLRLTTCMCCNYRDQNRLDSVCGLSPLL